MAYNHIRFTQGPLQDWSLRADSHYAQFTTHSRTVTLHHEPRRRDISAWRTGLSLTVPPDDPQWRLFAAATHSDDLHLLTTTAELALARLHTTIIRPGLAWQLTPPGNLLYGTADAECGATVSVCGVMSRPESASVTSIRHGACCRRPAATNWARGPPHST